LELNDKFVLIDVVSQVKKDLLEDINFQLKNELENIDKDSWRISDS